MTRRRRGVSGIAAAAALGALAFGALHVAGGLRRLDLVACDRFFNLRGARQGDERVVFVDIDQQALDQFGQFPIPRKTYARIIERLSRPDSRAAAIGFDIFLVEPSKQDWEADEQIGAAARSHGNVYFPAIFTTPFAAKDELPEVTARHRQLIEDAAHYLLGNPEFSQRFLSDPLGKREELVRRLRQKLSVAAGDITPMIIRQIDEEYIRRTWLVVTSKVKDGEQTAFIKGELDERLRKDLTPPWRLTWAKGHFLALSNTRTLWEQIYLPILAKDPQATFMGACSGRGMTYSKLVHSDRLPQVAKARDRMLRAKLARLRGVAADAFGPSVLASYSGRVPKEFPVLPVLDSTRHLVNVQPDLSGGDGKVRRFPLMMVQGDQAYPSMGLAAALDVLKVNLKECRIEDGEFLIPSRDGRAPRKLSVDRRGRVLVDWKGPWTASYRHVSVSSLLPPSWASKAAVREADRLAATMKGKAVFIGLTAPGTHDYRAIPLAGEYPMVGVHGHVADGVLNGFFPREAGVGLVLSLVILSAAFGAATGGAVAKLMSPFVAAAGVAAVFFGCFADFPLAGVLVPPVASLGALGLSYVGALFWRYLVTEREGRKVKQVFAFRTSPELVEEMMRNPEVVRLGGKRVSATVFFADLGGFTTVAESTEPEDLIVLLNAYLSEISAAVIEGGGYLDKYEGDAVMAILGAPVERKDHAAAACRAALDTQSRLDRLRAELGAAGRPLFRCRIGLASGDVVVGNIGSETRFDYTALGDNVNLASRLEGANKVYGTRILVSENTAETAGSDFLFREVDRIRVKGRRGAGRVMELVACAGDLDEARREGLAEFARALELYRGRSFGEACDLFMSANENLGGSDGPCETMIGRCQRYAVKPPPDSWDGVYEMTGK
ncbi:MAG: CHASE2 domain-containing protein [Planctomycetota bacterium]|jgi:adenylate cyclase